METPAPMRSYQAVCEDYHSDDSDGHLVKPKIARKASFDENHTWANSSTKRSAGAENTSQRSDSGYSSFTAGTMSSADSAAPVKASKFSDYAEVEQLESDTEHAHVKTIIVEGSRGERRLQIEYPTERSRPRRRPTERRDGRTKECTDPSCSQCSPSARPQQRRRPSIGSRGSGTVISTRSERSSSFSRPAIRSAQAPLPPWNPGEPPTVYINQSRPSAYHNRFNYAPHHLPFPQDHSYVHPGSMMPPPAQPSNYPWGLYGQPPGYPTPNSYAQSYSSRDRSPPQVSYAESRGSERRRGISRTRVLRAPPAVIVQTPSRKTAKRPPLPHSSSSVHDDDTSGSDWSVTGDVGKDPVEEDETTGIVLDSGIQIVIGQKPHDATERSSHRRKRTVHSESGESNGDESVIGEMARGRGRIKVTPAKRSVSYGRSTRSRSRIRSRSRVRTDIVGGVLKTSNRKAKVPSDVTRDDLQILSNRVAQGPTGTETGNSTLRTEHGLIESSNERKKERGEAKKMIGRLVRNKLHRSPGLMLHSRLEKETPTSMNVTKNARALLQADGRSEGEQNMESRQDGHPEGKSMPRPATSSLSVNPAAPVTAGHSIRENELIHDFEEKSVAPLTSIASQKNNGNPLNPHEAGKNLNDGDGLTNLEEAMTTISLSPGIDARKPSRTIDPMESSAHDISAAGSSIAGQELGILSSTPGSNSGSDGAYEQCEVHVNDALNSAMNVVKNLLLQQLFDQALPEATDASDGTTTSSSGSTGSSSPSLASSSTTSQNPSRRKRARGNGRDPGDGDGDGDDSDNDDDRPKKKGGRGLGDRFPQRRLKCPFYQRHPDKHNKAACRGSGFVDMAKLKDHIKRVHTQPLRCSRCWLEMESEEVYSKHLQQENICEKAAEPLDDRIRPQLLKRLDFKKAPYSNARNVEEKWKMLYGVLFPSDSAIPPPYEQQGMSPQLERALYEALEEELTRELALVIEPIMMKIKGCIPAIIERCREKLRSSSPSSEDEAIFTPSATSSVAGISQSESGSATRHDSPHSSFIASPPPGSAGGKAHDPAILTAEVQKPGAQPSAIHANQRAICHGSSDVLSGLQAHAQHKLGLQSGDHRQSQWNDTLPGSEQILMNSPHSNAQPVAQPGGHGPNFDDTFNTVPITLNGACSSHTLSEGLSQREMSSSAQHVQSSWLENESSWPFADSMQEHPNGEYPEVDLANGSFAHVDWDTFMEDFNVPGAFH